MSSRHFLLCLKRVWNSVMHYCYAQCTKYCMEIMTSITHSVVSFLVSAFNNDQFLIKILHYAYYVTLL